MPWFPGLGALGAHADTSVIFQETGGLGGGVSGGNAPCGAESKQIAGPANVSTGCGIRVGDVPSFGCEDMIMPGNDESPQALCSCTAL